MTWATAGLGWPAVTPLMRDMEMGPAGLQQDYSRTTAGQRGSSGVQLTLLLHQSNHAAFRTSFFVHHPQILECISICKENNSSKL